MNSGIYCIENIKTGKKYIGQSVNLDCRIKAHKNALKRNSHSNPHLQNSFNIYGLDVFIFSVIEILSESLLDEKEIYWINHHKSNIEDFGYNLETGGHSRKRLSQETRKKMSIKALNMTREHKEKISKAKKGIPPSEITRIAVSKALKGKTLSDEHRKKVSNGLIGTVFSNERKMNISAAKKGVPRTDKQKEANSLYWERKKVNPLLG